MALLINEQLAALEAYATHHLHQQLEELSVVYRAGEHKMSKVTWAAVIVLTARSAHLTVLQYAHTRVKETIEFTLCSRGIRNFAYGTP